jgi:phage-related baseplate assembly protein
MTTIINVADLPKPEAIETLSFEAIVTRQKAKFQEYWTAVRAANPALGLPDYNVAILETDPVRIVDEAENYREMLLRARINDSVRAVLPAFARRTDLDQVVARANVQRLPTAFDDHGNPIAWEDDAKLLDRYLAAFAAPAAGSEDGYIYQAATAWPQRHDIAIYGYEAPELGFEPGDVGVYLLAVNGGTVSDSELASVVRALNPKAARPRTDVVEVRRATVVNWALTAKLIIRRGASPEAVVAARRAAVQAFADARYRIGGLVTVAGAISALWDPNVINVEVTAPVVDVPSAKDKAPFLTAINLTYEVES